MSRQINAAAESLIKGFEAFRSVAYDDARPAHVLVPGDKILGTLTIAWGHTGEDVYIGQAVTEDEGEGLFQSDLRGTEDQVSAAVTVPLTDNQFGALVSITFNVGAGRSDKPGQPGRSGIIRLRTGTPSTLLAKLNNGDYAGAADQFLEWTSGGMPGLVRRRAAERELFQRPDDAEV
jgi:lysozyme